MRASQGTRERGHLLLGNKGYLKITFREQGNIDYLDFYCTSLWPKTSEEGHSFLFFLVVLLVKLQFFVGNKGTCTPPPPPWGVVKIILVPRGRNPSGQHQGSRPLPGSSTGRPIFRLIVKSEKPDWLKMQNKYSAHAPKIGSGHRSRFSVLTKRIAASGNKNA